MVEMTKEEWLAKHPQLMKADDVAELLGIHTVTVYKKAVLNQIPSLKIGKNRRFRADQIKKWLDKNEGEANV